MKPATMADIPALVGMAERLHDRHERRFSFHAEDMAAWFRGLIGNPAAFIAMTGGGFIAGVLAPAPQNNAWLVAHEVYWWSGDNSGVRLMRAFEEWARRQGASEIKFSHPVSADRVARVLGRMGHRPAEIAYTKG